MPRVNLQSAEKFFFLPQIIARRWELEVKTTHMTCVFFVGDTGSVDMQIHYLLDV